MNAATYGLVAAAGLAVGSVITKGMVDRLPFRQLIGPAYAFNALFLAPLVPFTTWHWSRDIVVLHVLSIVAISITTWGVFDLFHHGAASAVTTATASSPLPAALGVAILVPATFDWLETIVAVVIVGAVLFSVADSFPALPRGRAMATAALTSVGNGVIAVLTRLLVDEGVGLVETYVTRTGVAALLFMALIPPTNLSRGDIPGLAARSGFITIGWSMAILGIQQGSPTIVQAMVATTPLMVLALESGRSRKAPSGRVLVGALLVTVGVVVVVAG